MRVGFKYKNLPKQKYISLTISKRVLNFQKSKWLRLQRNIKKILKKKKFKKRKKLENKKVFKKLKKLDKSIHINFSKKKKISCSNKLKKNFDCFQIKKLFLKKKALLYNRKNKIEKIKSKKLNKLQIYKTNIIRICKYWFRNKNYFKKILNLKHYYFQLFDNNLSHKTLKKNFIQERGNSLNFFYQKYLILPNLKINILLWKLNFFKSAFEMQEFSQNKSLLLNFVQSKRNDFLLKKGDSVLLKKRISLRQQKDLVIINKIFFDFIEIEYFSNHINILKSLKELSYDKFFILLNNKSFNVKFLKDYFFR